MSIDCRATHFVGRAAMLLIFAVAFSSASHGQLEAPKAPPEQSFLRVLASLERIKELAGDEPFLPMNREKFNDIIASLQTGTPTKVRRNVSIDQATYTARFVDQELVDGRGTFAVSSTVDIETEIDLGRLSLPIESAAWRHLNQPAKLGQSNTGERVLLVPQTDYCDFRWSLRGVNNAGGVDFTFEVCDVLQHQFTITTPTNMRLSSNRGTVTLTSTTNERTWDVRVSGAGQVTLRAASEEATTQSRLAYVRQQTVFKASDTGLEAVATLELDDLAAGTTKIQCELSAGLHPVSVSVESVDTAWEVREIQHDGKMTIAIDLPILASDPAMLEASQGIHRTIQIKAIGAIVANQSLRMPRISIPNTEWMQEAAFVQLTDSIVISSLQLSDCKQTEYSVGESNRSYRFDYSALNGAIQVEFSRTQEKSSVEVGTAVTFTDSTASATMIADLSVERGSIFTVEALIHAGWTIETVEVRTTGDQAKELLDRWDEIDAGPADNRRLALRLRRPVTQKRPIRVRVSATRLLSNDNLYEAEDLEPLRFSGIGKTNRYLVVQSSESHRMQWTDGQNAEWLSLAKIPTSLRSSLGARVSDTILRLDQDRSGATFRLADSGATFATEWQLTSHVSDGIARETLRIGVTPTTGFVRQLEILSSDQAPFRWSVNPSSQAVIVEPRSSDGDWNRSLLRLQSATDQPFEIVGVRSVSFGEAYTLHGVQIPLATTQSGTVIVTAALDAKIDIKTTDGVHPAPHEALAPNGVQGTLHRFIVSPQALVSLNAFMTLGVSNRQANLHTTVWLEQPTTIVDPMRQHRHIVTLLVENHGDNALPIFVPTNCIVNDIIVDGRSVVSGNDEPGAFLVPLPSSNRHPVVQIDMSERQGSSVVAKRLGQRVTCPQVRIDVPVFERRWKVWTPPGAIPTLAEHWNSPLTSADVMSRFFGAFARRTESRPFDFFSDQSWLAMFRRNDEQDALRAAQLLSARLTHEFQGESATWREAITAFDDANRIAKSSSLIVPLIDSARLAERGILPESALVLTRSDDGNMNILADADLAIIVTRKRIYLTTAEALGMLTIPIEWTDIPNVVRAREGILSGDSTDERIAEDLGRFMTASSWLTDSHRSQWTLDVPDDLVMVASGWRLTPIEADSIAPSLLYIDHYFVTRISVVCFLMASCFSWLMSRLGAHWSIASILITAATCILLPSTIAAAGTMVFWGTIVGCLLHWSKRALVNYKRRPPTVTNGDATTVGLTKPAITALLAGSVMLWPVDVDAQENTPTKADHTEIVYIPTSEDGRPDAGNSNVYLSRSFYDKLLAYQVRSSGLAAKWIVESVDYRASIDKDSDAESIAVTSLFRLQTLDSDVQVSLAIPIEAMRMLQRDATLDRQPIRLQNTANTEKIELLFDDVDRYELELTFLVPVQSQGNTNSMVLPLLSVLNAQVQLSTFADIQTVSVMSRGAIERDNAQGELRANLGPSSQLDVKWQVDRPIDSTMDATATQVGWTHVNEDKVYHDFKLLIEYPTGQVRPVSIVADSRLQPNVNGDQPTSFDVLDGNRHRYYFLPTLESETEAIVQAQFDLIGVSSIGRIRLPRINVEGVDVRSHLLATSFGSSLVGIPWRTFGVTSVPLSEFTNAWRAESETPAHMYVVNDPNHTCIFACDSLEEESEVSLTTDFVVGETRTDIHLVATINSRSNSLYQARLRIPSDVAIESAIMVQGQGRRTVDWARTNESTVTFFLSGTTNGPISIKLTGHVNNIDGRFIAPSFAPMGMQSKDNRIAIFRRPHVQIGAIESENYSDITIGLREPRTSDVGIAIPHVAKTKDNDTATLICHVTAVPTTVDIECALLFEPSEEITTYNLRCRIAHANVPCDVLRIQVPADWGEPTLLNRPGTIRALPAPRSQIQIFEIQPQSPLAIGEVLQLNGTVEEGSPSELNAYISVTGGNVSQTLVGVLENDNVFWEPRGMETYSSAVPEYAGITGDAVLYRVVGERAVLQRSQRVQNNDTAIITSVRHSVFVDDHATQLASDISIVAQGQGEIILNLPVHGALQQVLANGVPLQVDTESKRGIPLPIANSNELQNLRLIWTTNQFSLRKTTLQNFDFPQLLQMSVDRSGGDQHLTPSETIWQFRLPKEATGIEFFVGDRQLESDPTHVSQLVSHPNHDDDRQLVAFRLGRVGDATETRLHFSRTSRRPVYLRWGAAMAAIVGGLIVVQTRFKPFSVAEADLWVYTGSVLCGIAWWLFLQPRLFGGIIIACVLIIAWLGPW